MTKEELVTKRFIPNIARSLAEHGYCYCNLSNWPAALDTPEKIVTLIELIVMRPNFVDRLEIRDYDPMTGAFTISVR